MNYNPDTHIAIARARQEDLIRQAERDQLARSFKDERPSVVSRLRSYLSRRRSAQPRPVTA